MRYALFLLLLALPLTLAAAPLAPETPAPSGRVVLQLADGWRMADDGVTATRAGDAAAFTARLAALAPGGELERRFSAPAARLDALRPAGLPDLNGYAQLSAAFAPGDRAAGEALLARLRRDPAIASAWLEPVAVPAALGFDAFALARGEAGSPAGPPPGAADAIPTPDFSGQQGYLDDAPTGVGAWSVAGQAGALGASVRVIDIEGAWLWSHEDLPAPIAEIGSPIADIGWRNHGTAVLGEIRGDDNGLGVRGIAPQAGVGGSSIGTQSVADAILNAALALEAGDILLIELHAPGPNANGSGQFGYVPMEFWQDNFDAIQTVTALGRIVCEAAGNGSQDLDDPVYQGLFDRGVRDSGAIMCGATDGSTLLPAYFTNYGSRVDLHGWGFNVVSCGYGNLQGDPLPEEQWYTSSFSGTSSASPIVVGSVASLQGMVESAYGFSLDASLARTLLVATGTPQEQPQTHIGPRPNLVGAWGLVASQGLGRVSGTVTDVVSAQPLAGVSILVAETGAFVSTDAAGHYAVVAQAGTLTLDFEDFFHETKSVPVPIFDGSNATLDVALTPLELLTLSGHIEDEAGTALAGAVVTPVDVPLAPAVSAPGGDFDLLDVPAGVSFPLRVGGLPGHGAAWLGDWQVVGQGLGNRQALPYTIVLPDADETFEASNGGFSSSGDPVWSWGTPTAGGPPSAFSGSKCWGVGMTGDYGDNQSGSLLTPTLDMSGVDALNVSFHIWRGTESGFDGVRVRVYDGGQWYPLTPMGGYTDLLLGGLGNEAGWSGSSSDWEPVVFRLTEHLGADFRLRFDFGSDGGVVGPGFWLDDLSFFAGAVVTAAENAPLATRARVDAWPNPFNPSTTVAWSLPSAGSLRLDVYDPAGRHLRTLREGPALAGPGSLLWDGRDEAGRPLPSGVYLLQLRGDEGLAASRRVVLLK